MRAVYSAGAIVPLIEYGFTGVFNHVIGSSAGGINGAYFLSSDADTFRTYTEDLTNKNFVNLLRPNKKIDIDYLVDTVIKHKRPVDIERLRKTTSKLHIVLTDAVNGRKTVISDHADFEKIYEEFRATAALPFFYDKPVALSGRTYVDGGVADLIPVDVALKLGCTDIVMVLTQRLENYHFNSRRTRLIKRIVKQLAKNQPKSIQNIFPTNEKLLQVNLRRLRHPGKKIRIYVLEPSDNSALFQLYDTDKQKVETLAKLGISDMDQFLHKEIV